MKLYNTLSKCIETVRPHEPPIIGVYSCGPTVYDYPHIGNWFTFIRYDLLIRTLRAEGYKTKWIMNITDVGHLVSDADEGEDKVEKRAIQAGKSATEVAEFYSEYFIRSLEALNITYIDRLPRASEHIAEQISMIQSLESKHFTYIIDDGVYFDTKKFPNYGKFAQLELDELQAGARVVFNPQKRNSSDFAVWKLSPAHSKRDMEWDSPWGIGFPGWHIECSAMSLKYLDDTLDIHAGGIDHIPVHHTNEIAQSEAATGKQYFRYWMHANHILINDQKIAKSSANGITLEAIIDHGFTLEAFRLLVLESHYRHQSKFSWENLAAAQNRLSSYRAMSALRWQAKSIVHDSGTFSLEDVPDELLSIMASDLNTPEALAYLSEVATQLNAVLLEIDMVDHFVNMLNSIDALLGLNLIAVTDISNQNKQIIEQRELARQQQDWQKADALRDKLAIHKIGVRDTESGVIWFPL